MDEKPKKLNWRGVVRGNVVMLGVVSFFTDLSSEMVYPLLPVFFSGLVPSGTVAIYIGLMDGIGGSVASLLKILSGRLSDSLGARKPFVVLGYGISSLGRPCLALVTAGWHVVGLRFFDRLGKGFRTSPRDALIVSSTAPETRAMAFSFHRAMDHAGAVIGPLAAILILYIILGYALWDSGSGSVTQEEMKALRWVFGIALIPGIFAMTALIGKVKEIPPQAAAPEERLTGGPKKALRKLPKKFYYYLATVTVFSLGNSSDLFLVFYAQTKFQFGLSHFIGLWVMLHISKIIFSFPGGVLSDKFGRRVMILSGWTIYIFVYLGMAFVSSQWMIWALVFVYGSYYGLTEGAEKALVADYVSSDQYGRAYGLYHGFVGLAALPASLLFGVFWSILGPEAAFTIGASLAGAAVLLLSVLAASGKKDG